MKKIVLDADGLIKLTKAEIIKDYGYKLMISNAVFRETVVEGKKRMYNDADKIESLMVDGIIETKKVKEEAMEKNLGKGELSTLDLFREEKADLIISDDKKFLESLANKGIPFIVPTEFIVSLVNNKKIKKDEGISALKKLKSIVRKENYEEALNALEEQK